MTCFILSHKPKEWSARCVVFRYRNKKDFTRLGMYSKERPMVPGIGVEPTSSGFSDQRSDRLSYPGICRFW